MQNAFPTKEGMKSIYCSMYMILRRLLGFRENRNWLGELCPHLTLSDPNADRRLSMLGQSSAEVNQNVRCITLVSHF
jgi:hypothetical protein